LNSQDSSRNAWIGFGGVILAAFIGGIFVLRAAYISAKQAEAIAARPAKTQSRSKNQSPSDTNEANEKDTKLGQKQSPRAIPVPLVTDVEIKKRRQQAWGLCEQEPIQAKAILKELLSYRPESIEIREDLAIACAYVYRQEKTIGYLPDQHNLAEWLKNLNHLKDLSNKGLYDSSKRFPMLDQSIRKVEKLCGKVTKKS